MSDKGISNLQEQRVSLSCHLIAAHKKEKTIFGDKLLFKSCAGVAIEQLWQTLDCRKHVHEARSLYATDCLI